MSMIEHAVGVVSLDRFAEISHMDHDEIGALLLDTMAENAKLRKLCKTLYQLADESYVPFGSANRWMDDFAKAICAMRELGIEVDE